MIVSLNSIRAFNDRYHTREPGNLPLDQLVDKIEGQLGATDHIDYVKDKYSGATVVKVVSVKPHPQADKLSICLIDDNKSVNGAARNDDGLIQVVCGAPNVAEKMLAVWLPVGTTVPSSKSGEPFVLEAKDIRGVTSNGMLASAKELDLFDDEAGILEVDQDKSPGQPFDEAYSLKDDTILSLENKMFTHRPDCFGLMGIAREISGIEATPYSSPEWYKKAPSLPSGESLPIKLTNELTNLVPRFILVSLKNVTVKPSPTWLQIELAKAGFRPINNIVDLSNYIMYLTAQPLHAYDYDKVKKLSGEETAITIRNPKPDESLVLINGKTIKPRAEAILIATDNHLIGVGGVMGGQETEVDSGTKNIIIECGTFDMYSIRKTAMEHGLFTDAVTRFTKGQSPLQNPAVITEMVQQVLAIAGGEVASGLIDNNNLPKEMLERGSLHVPVTVTSDFINERLGLALSPEEMSSILTKVECQTSLQGSSLTVKAPFWRTDIELREDVVEEVGRLYGLDKLPLQLPKRTISPVIKNQLMETKRKIRTRLMRAGANEVLTYSFVHGDLMEKVGQSSDKAFKVSNAISPVLQYYRLSLTPSLLEKIHPNIKAGYDEFALFELGKSHAMDNWDDQGLPAENDVLALVYSANDKLKKSGSPYYVAKTYLETLLRSDLTYAPLNDELARSDQAKPFDANRSAAVHITGTGELLGIVGEYKQSVLRALKLPRFSCGFEIDLSPMTKLVQNDPGYTPIPRFPFVYQDITLGAADNLSYQELHQFLNQQLESLKPEQTTASIFPLDIYASKDVPAKKHYSFRLKIASYVRTLTDAEVNKLLDSLADSSAKKFSSQRV